jgi:hypothetical protein
MRQISTAAVVVTLAAVLPGTAQAHHSFADFNQRYTVGLEGEVTEIRWRNPHVTMKLAVTDENGEVRTWDLETESLGMLRRMNVNSDVIHVGDRVKVAGHPAFDGSFSLYAHHILLPDGAELVLRDGPVFSRTVVGNLSNWSIPSGSTAQPELGLFRVWSTTMASLLTPAPNDTGVDPLSLLTSEAQRRIAAFDPVATSREAGCKHPGVPRIMQQPDDMAFSEDGEDILLSIEEFDTVRRIDMTPDADRASKPLTTLGYSTGAWEGRTLVVTTTNIAVPEIQWALPQSEQIETVERFTPSEDGSRLDYELTLADPTYFQGPLRFSKYWIALEGAVIDPYECVED